MPDVGPNTAGEIVEFFQDEENSELIDELFELGVQPQPIGGVASELGPFAGKTIVVTGKLEMLSREDAEELIRKLGGKAAGSVSKNTQFVVAGPGAGTKLENARKLGVKVIDEAEFIKMLPKDLLP